MSKLPGTFSIFPKGPKPKSTAPHGQHALISGSMHFQISGGKKGADYGPAGLRMQVAAPKGGPKSAGPTPYNSGKRGPDTVNKAHTEDWDPYGNYYFALEINGAEIAHFQECSGLKNASAVFEIEEGGLNGKVHKRPGQSKWDNIVLKCATSASQFLVEWRDLYLQDMYAKPTVGPDKRDWWGTTTGAISLKRNDGKVIRRYSFVEAWPVSWEGPALNSTASGLAIETLEIAHGGLTVETVNAG